MTRSSDNPPLAVQAAKGSWVAPLLALAVSFFGSGLIKGESARGVALVLMGAMSVLALSGFVLGCGALLSMRKQEAGRILVPALIGTLLSSGLIYLYVTLFWYQSQR